MRHALALCLTALGLAALAPTPAHAEGRLGLGVETSLNNLGLNTGSLLFVFDNTDWRIDGLFGLAATDGGVALSVGGRFDYVVHKSERADLAIGAGAYLLHATRGNGLVQGGGTRGEVDAQAQIRAFLTPSVALYGALGMGISFGDGGFLLSLAGRLSGSFGIAYFF